MSVGRRYVCCIPSRPDGNQESDDVGTDIDTQQHACQYRHLHAHQRTHNGNSIDPDPCMSIESGPHGIHAIASRDIKAGSIVVQCLPLAHSILVPPGAPVIDDDESDYAHGRDKRCARCFFKEGGEDPSGMRNKKFGRCSKCRVAFYCSRSCQADDWVGQHKLECQYFVKRRKQSPMSSAIYASTADEDAIPLLLRTFNSLKQWRDRPDTTTEIDGNTKKDVEVNQQEGIAIACGPLHFSSLMVSPDYYKPGSCETSPMSLAKGLIENHAVRGSSLKKSEDSKETKQLAACIWGYNGDDIKGKSTSTTDRAIQRTLNAFKKNNFGIVNSLHSPIGEGVYPCAALLNHSCHPNCILRYKIGVVDNSKISRYHPPILQIIAIRDIDSGEELCHSYVDLALCTKERQARLLDTHGFVCECKRCTKGNCLVKLPKNRNEWSLWPLTNEFTLDRGSGSYQSKTCLVEVDIDDAMNESSFSEHDQALMLHQSVTLQQQANRCMLEGNSTGELHCLEKAIALYTSGGKVSPFSDHLYSLRGAHLSALLANSLIIDAASECEHIVSFLAVAFSHVQNHPLLGLQLYTLGDLYSGAAALQEDWPSGEATCSYKQKAKKAYTWAKRVMAVTHGNNDQMVKKLEDNLASL